MSSGLILLPLVMMFVLSLMVGLQGMGLANLTGSFPVAQLNGTVTNQGNLWGGSVSDNMSLWCHVKSYTAGGQYVDIWVHPNDTIAIYYFEGYSNAVGNCTVGGNRFQFLC